MQQKKHIIELLQTVSYLYFNNIDVEVTAIHYDSRKVTPGSVYVARAGSVSDGHNFIDSAILNGAVAVVCEVIPHQIIDKNIAIIQVGDSAKALAELSHAFFDFPSKKLTIIGITGTNGKTTCTYILKQIFECLGKQVGIIGTTGNYSCGRFIPSLFTTPEAPELCSLFTEMINDGVENVFMEVSSHALALNRVWGIEFRGAMFTNLTQDHLDFHSSMSEYADAKKILFDSLSPDAIAVLHSDDNYAQYMCSGSEARVHFVGRKSPSTFTILNELLNSTESSFTLRYENLSYLLTTPLIGSFNIENVAISFVMASELLHEPEKIAQCLAFAGGAPGRMHRIPLRNKAVGIVDYSHTPDALEKALTTCKQLLSDKPSSKLVCVFGCGGDRDSSKPPIMGRISY